MSLSLSLPSAGKGSTSSGGISQQQQQLDRWGIFSLMEPELWHRVAWAVVFGTNGSEALLLMRPEVELGDEGEQRVDECQVLSVGTNLSGCLGLGDAQSCLSPVEVTALRGVDLCEFASGSGPHCLALERGSGRLYCWGHNGYGQLGNGGTNQLLTPAPCAVLDGLHVLAIACGANHSLAVVATDGGGVAGELFSWGQNNYGQVGCGAQAPTQATPRRVGGSLASRLVRLVGCCQASSFAVDELGELHSWGFNGSGQLGTGGCANQPMPTRLESGAPRGPVTRLACGTGHVLVVAASSSSPGGGCGGQLYAWGANSHGQLGTGGKSNSAIPTLVAMPQLNGSSATPVVFDVGAVHYSNLSAAVVVTSAQKSVLAWGLCRGQSLPAPVATRFASLNDAFACLSSPPVTCRRIEICSGLGSRPTLPAPTVAESVRQAFNDPATSDVVFRVDGHDLRAHRSLLQIRCAHFRSMLGENWAENKQDVIPVQFYAYSVYRAFLEYLYTDTVTLPEGEYEATAVGLLDLANCYCEEHLKALCQELISRCVSVDNVLALYSAAVKYSAESLQSFCFDFAVHNLTQVVATESFAQLDEATLKQFMQSAGRAGAFRY